MHQIIIASIILFLGQIAYSFETEAKYAVLMDYDTKTILFDKAAETRMAPASMSKVMTAYIAFEYLKSDQITLDEKVLVSENAWKMGGTRMFIPLNSLVSYENLIKGLIIQSGNDAAVAIAENLAGSEAEFAEKMNETAHKLGMTNTNFTNASGWPDKNNYSSMKDLAILAYHTIKDFPEYYHYYAQTEFTFNNIKQGNRNGLLYRNMGADGLKTGHSDESGYGVVTSIKRNGRRLISVVNGLKSNKERTNQVEKLMNYGITNFVNIKIADAGQPLEKILVNNGKQKDIELVSPEDIILTVKRSESRGIKTKFHYFAPATAPIEEGANLGEILIEGPSSLVRRSYPLVAKTKVDKANFMDRIQSNFLKIFN